MTIAIYTVLALAALLALHRFLTYAEDRGWIYYRKKRGSYGGLHTTTNFLNMYDPSRKHLQEAVRESEWKRDEDDDGDDPSTQSRPPAADSSLRAGPDPNRQTLR
jgi:hypothetical protein